MAGLPFIVPHGNGAREVGAESDRVSLPTSAPIDASGLPGGPRLPPDLAEDYDEDGEFILRPVWNDNAEGDVGSRGEQRQGSGGPDQEERRGSDAMGQFGIMTANWGGERFMKQDPGVDEADSPAVTGHRPLRQFIGAAGIDRGSTIMIFARPPHVKGMRTLVFHRTGVGTYSITQKNRARTRVTKIAVSRMLIASAKMRFWQTRGSGGGRADDQAADEFRLANVHLNHRTAKRDLQG
ncbi:unnamed protein product, partial [Prorocentrum cordatum]